ncbi:MAG: hypothetical protein R3B07_02260 [Polyangiaceae bacterium]
MRLNLTALLVAAPLCGLACNTPESAKSVGESSGALPTVPVAKPSADLPYVAPAVLPDAGQPDGSMDAGLGGSTTRRR